MATYLDYLAWRGDLSMKERPFNEVDNLILAELVYLHFGLVLDKERDSVTIGELWELFRDREDPRGYWNNDPTHLLEPLSRAERFAGVTVTDFVDIVDKERGMQFAAATFHLGDGTRYVAFRGTDSSLVGWKEDFDFSYMEQTPAQLEAVRYLERSLKLHHGSVRVGGHSKGGNLAIYAAAFCRFHHRRIIEVYSNDGPGFNQLVVGDPLYQEVLPKVRLLLPESSVVSILLSNKKERTILRSSAIDGVHQHLPITWLVERDRFQRAEEQSAVSIRLNALVENWMERLDDRQKEAFVTTVFDVLDASGVTTLEELDRNRWLCYNAILKAAVHLSDEERHSILDSLHKLAEASREVLRNDVIPDPFRLKNREEEEAQSR